jgi:hypothetical protein
MSEDIEDEIFEQANAEEWVDRAEVETINDNIQREVTKHGVHASHCCAKHGCKYGDNMCAVTQGVVAQMYPCETCDFVTVERSNASDMYGSAPFIVGRVYGEPEYQSHVFAMGVSWYG